MTKFHQIRKLIDKLERLGYGLRKASGNHFNCFCSHCIFVLGEENYANDLECSWKLSAIDTTMCIELGGHILVAAKSFYCMAKCSQNAGIGKIGLI